MPPINYKDIVWEDDDSGLDGKKKKINDGEMVDWLAQENFAQDDHIRTGAQVEGTILSISEISNDVIVEITSRTTGVLDKQEICDPETGELKYNTGDRIKAYVISRREGEVQLSTSLSGSRAAESDLRTAYQNKIPVKGRVVKENSGGFDVMIMGKRAFCPVSQIDRGYVLNKAQFLNQELTFLIEKFEGGRNIVVSRAKLLEQEAQIKIQELRQRLDQDVIMEGVVKDVKDFGAIIDLGGFEGFVHISEMSYSRVANAFDFVNRGEKVRVKVLGIDEKDGKTRISLSMKAAANDPWIEALDRYKVGSNYQARVNKLEKFGAFVELEPGIEGLVHVSEMSWTKRVMHPSEVLKVGDAVTVRILNIDTSTRKISLSLKEIDKDPWLEADKKYSKDTVVTGKVQSLKGFGAIIELEEGVTGLVPISTLRQAYGESYRKKCSPPQTHTFKVVKVDKGEKRILLAPPDIDVHQDEFAEYREYLQETQKSAEATKATRPSQQGTFGALLAEKLKQHK